MIYIYAIETTAVTSEQEHHSDLHMPYVLYCI